MLTREENELITRVGRGTPCGELFRQYWLPVLLSSELPGPDCPPQRVRVLGEDLVAFRATSGRVGLLAENCPHRGASLFFGRNEEEGLRCVYHGWKFDVAGKCVDMPNEPAESNFKHKIHHTAYPCHEVNGVIWTYLGPRREPPPFPRLPWTLVPEANHAAAKITEDCNWVQVLEGDFDAVHAEFLHFDAERGGAEAFPLRRGYEPPHLEILFTEAGFTKASRHSRGPEQYHWRLYQFLMPCFGMLPAAGDAVNYRVAVPIDDGHTTFWNGRYSTSRELRADERLRPGTNGYSEYQPNTSSDPLRRWRMVTTLENNYLMDYEAQRSRQRFSGIPPVKPQDLAMTESMGTVMDRSREHLGTTDAAIIQMRRLLLAAIKGLRDHGATPPGVDSPDCYAVHSASVALPRSADWIEATREQVRADSGMPLLSAP